MNVVTRKTRQPVQRAVRVNIRNRKLYSPYKQWHPGPRDSARTKVCACMRARSTLLFTTACLPYALASGAFRHSALVASGPRFPGRARALECFWRDRDAHTPRHSLRSALPARSSNSRQRAMAGPPRPSCPVRAGGLTHRAPWRHCIGPTSAWHAARPRWAECPSACRSCTYTCS